MYSQEDWQMWTVYNCLLSFFNSRVLFPIFSTPPMCSFIIFSLSPRWFVTTDMSSRATAVSEAEGKPMMRCGSKCILSSSAGSHKVWVQTFQRIMGDKAFHQSAMSSHITCDWPVPLQIRPVTADLYINTVYCCVLLWIMLCSCREEGSDRTISMGTTYEHSLYSLMSYC